MKKHANKLRTSLILLILTISSIGMASAEQTVITYNQANNGYWNIDQNLSIEQKAPMTFWANYFNFINRIGNGGYLGLQTTSVGDKALFSVWNANAAYPTPYVNGSGCQPFVEFGNGYQCYLPINITTKTIYTLRIWGLDSDTGGQWWGAWISDGTSSNFIGKIRVDSSEIRLRDSVDFSEYYGIWNSDCSQIPRSIVSWQAPTFNNKESTASFNGYYTDTCNSNSNVTTQWIKVDKGS